MKTSLLVIKVLLAVCILASDMSPALAEPLRRASCDKGLHNQSLSLVVANPTWRLLLKLPEERLDTIAKDARTPRIQTLLLQYQRFVSIAHEYEKALAARVSRKKIEEHYAKVFREFLILDAAIKDITSRPVTAGEFNYLAGIDAKADFFHAAKRNMAYYAVYAYHITGQRDILIEADRRLFGEGVILFNLAPHPRPGLHDGNGVRVKDFGFGQYAGVDLKYLRSVQRRYTDPDSFLSLRLYLELSGPRRTAELKRLFYDSMAPSITPTALTQIQLTGTPEARFPVPKTLEKLVQGCSYQEMSSWERVMTFRASYALATASDADYEAALQAVDAMADAARWRKYFQTDLAAALYWRLRLLDSRKRISAPNRKSMLDKLWATGLADQDPLAWYALCDLDQNRCK